MKVEWEEYDDSQYLILNKFKEAIRKKKENTTLRRYEGHKNASAQHLEGISSAEENAADQFNSADVRGNA